MADVQLYNRSGLPPAQAGQAKPPYQLADQSGQKQFGQTLAKFSGDVFDSLVKTRAANEEAEFQGGVNTSIESFKTYVAANPNASFDDLQKERDRVMAEIKTASGKATTGIGRENNARWASENEGLISQRLQTSMEAVASEQELARSEVLIEGYINNLDEKGLTDHYAKTVESGLYLSEVADARLKNDLEVMRVAKQAMAVENVETQAKAAPDLESALDIIDQSDLLNKDKRSMETSLESYFRRREELDEEKLEVAQAQKEAEAWNLWQEGELTTTWVKSAFNAGELSESARDAYIKRLEAANITTNRSVLWDVKENRLNVKMGNMSPDKAKEFLLKNNTKLDDTDYGSELEKLNASIADISEGKTVKSSVKRGYEALGRLRTDTKSLMKLAGDYSLESQQQIEMDFLDVENDFEQWVEENPEASDDEVTKKINSLTIPIKEEATGGIIKRAFNFWAQSPFGAPYRKVWGVDKKTDEPQTQEDFNTRVAELKANDMEDAREYYDKWKDKW